MVFSSTVFLFLFLPLALSVYYLSPRSLRNGWLLIASLGFYAWGELGYLLVILMSIGMNYGFGRWIAASPFRLPLVLGVSANLALLGFFKYANFLVDNLDALLVSLGGTPLGPTDVHLPIGISFFTFQALSYLIDLRRSGVHVQRNPYRLALYISLFPQLIAGPIVRYAQVEDQLESRTHDLDGFVEGVRRFVIGLAKKLLLANTVAVPVDRIFALPADELSLAIAWFGIACYALQIYFDFSGYSDMAIGLGRMFGFHFPENFERPYLSRSIREFWRRWHISLSTWFRDYLYVPLGGNRRSAARVQLNLITVFLLCGLWHGASWNFAVWGLFHGAFLVLERTGLESWRAGLWRPLQHVYALLVVAVAWVFFRAETMTHAVAYLKAMVGAAKAAGPPLAAYAGAEAVLAALVGVVAIALSSQKLRLDQARSSWALGVGELAMLAVLFVAAAMKLASGTHNPFIYFRF